MRVKEEIVSVSVMFLPPNLFWGSLSFRSLVMQYPNLTPKIRHQFIIFEDQVRKVIIR